MRGGRILQGKTRMGMRIKSLYCRSRRGSYVLRRDYLCAFRGPIAPILAADRSYAIVPPKGKDLLKFTDEEMRECLMMML